ncbi:EAL domain-containing protein [Marinicella sp. W31]|uniref:EAL domain-containing protein n=1 Tax=Marinicella sp. W31 TaxID=3023713 RepID=UPI003757C0A6
MRKISSLLNRLNKNSQIIALQDASITLVPMILAVTLLVMLTELLALYSTLPIVLTLRSIYHHFYIFFPFLFTITLSLSLAKSLGLHAATLILLCCSLLFLFVADSMSSLENLNQSTFYKLLPIPLCLATANLYRYFSQKKQLQIIQSNDVSFNIKSNFNYILPLTITFAIIISTLLLMDNLWQKQTDIQHISELIEVESNNFLHIIYLKLTYKITWFFGINPSHIFSFLERPFHAALIENQLAFNNQLPIPNINASGMYFFSDIGGAGSAACLLIAILMFSKSRRNKKIAKLSVLPSSFNISEILHYGLPIVFNPFLFVPFVIVPIILHFNAYFFTWIGWLSPVVAPVTWTTPPFLNVFLATGGDFMAVVIQLLNLVIGTLIYLYFLKMFEASNLDDQLVSHFYQKIGIDSKNMQTLQYRNQHSLTKKIDSENEINTALARIIEGNLKLFFQPILSIKENRIVKVEALIRLEDPDGHISLPTFIDTLTAAGLSKEIDQWVIKTVVQQSQQWANKLENVSISINISPEFLLKESTAEFLIEMQQQAKHHLNFEILENQVVFNERKINENLKKLRDHGIETFLDDFGSGYSALSLLSKLNIDGVKYDLGFARSLDSDEGSQLFSSCINVSQALNHTTVLEGIETQKQFEIAKKSGVDMIQGYYISKPLDAQQLIDYMAQRKP